MASSSGVSVSLSTEALTAGLLDAIQCPLILVDSSGRIHELNEAAYKVLKLPVREIIQKDLWEVFLIPEDSNLSHEYEAYGYRWKFTALHFLNQIDLFLGTGIQSSSASDAFFVSTLVHEMNTPLGTLLMSLDLLREIPARFSISLEAHQLEKFQTLVGRSRSSVLHLRNLVSDLKFLTANLQEPVELVNLESVLEESLKIVSPHFGQEIVVKKFWNPVAKVLSNPHRLTQVFINLLVNACYVLQEKTEKTREISLVLGENSRGDVVVEVSDNGPGIPEEIQSRVFELFFTTKPSGVGTGLGLNISQQIIQSYDGQISFKTKPAEGTTFFVVSTRCEDSECKEKRVRSEEPARSKILIIDYNRKSITLLVEVLSQRYEVIVADTAHGAFKILDQDSEVRLVLCDCALEDLSATLIYRQIQRNYPGLEKHIVFFSGGGKVDFDTQFISRVGALVIEKPFSLQYIREVVADFIKTR